MFGPQRLLRSATLRMAVLVFVLQMVVTGGILLYASTAISDQFTREQQNFVSELQSDLAGWQRRNGDSALAAEITTRLATLKGENLLLLLTDSEGRILAGNLDGWPPVVPTRTAWRTIDLFRTGSERVERIGLSAQVLPGGAHLLTGRVIETDLRLTQIGERVLVAAFLLTIPLAALVAGAASRLINSRVAGIATTAAAVGGGDLAKRVPLDGSGDSFDRLGAGVNAMLGRIETLVTELRIVTGGLAHDLRAPLFRLTATLEDAMQATDDPVAVAAMDRVSTEAGILQAMLSTALQISQAEAGIGRNRFETVDLAVMLADIAELYEPVVEDRGMVLQVLPTTGRFLLHRELIAQALGNLVDNALHYATGASAITLSSRLVGDDLELIVADDGVGIAAADHEIALRRFGRIDPSRHGTGAGLGLSLVEAVARLHGGTVTLEDNGPGLRVVLRLHQHH